MQRQQTPEDLRILAKSLQGPLLQPRPSVQCEHQPRHGARPQHQAPVFLLIRTQIPGFKTTRQRHRLRERQSQTFPGDGIHSPGSIANQGHIAFKNAGKCTIARKRPAFRRDGFGTAQASA